MCWAANHDIHSNIYIVQYEYMSREVTFGRGVIIDSEFPQCMHEAATDLPVQAVINTRRELYQYSFQRILFGQQTMILYSILYAVYPHVDRPLLPVLAINQWYFQAWSLTRSFVIDLRYINTYIGICCYYNIPVGRRLSRFHHGVSRYYYCQGES